MQAFLCNGMLGKLCKFMRLCGFDTAYSNQGAAILVKARREDRIILSRNARYKNKTNVFYLSADDPLEQLRIVIKQYDLRGSIAPFSRCLECNVPLETVDKIKVQDRVPYYTFKHFKEFSECPNCHKVYWKGSHYKKMVQDINMLVSCLDKNQP
jgi:uncharacterized protein with PIN domain